jgi:hypothetical protein
MKSIIDEAPDIIHGEENEQEIFSSTVMDLEQEYGTAAILCVLQEIAEEDSRNQEYCADYRAEAAFLAFELTQLLTRLARRLEPRFVINAAGSGLMR